MQKENLNAAKAAQSTTETEPSIKPETETKPEQVQTSPENSQSSKQKELSLNDLDKVAGGAGEEITVTYEGPIHYFPK